MYKGIKGLVVYCSLVAVIRMETKYESPVSFRITPKKTPSNSYIYLKDSSPTKYI